MLLVINLFNENDIKRLKKSEISFFQGFQDNRKIIYLDYKKKNNCEEEIQEIIHNTTSANNVIIFVDNNVLLSRSMYRCFFIATIEITDMPDSYISKQISQKKKNFNAVYEAFRSANMIEPLRLPFRSFASDILKNFDDIMSNIGETFKVDFEKNLSDLKKKHRNPMRRSSSKQKYYVDANKLYFSLGKEEHSRHETNPPHTLLCDLSAKYRFGCRIDEFTHFNVCNENSSENRLTINLINCHDATIQRKKVTHLNIFSNDFIT